MFKPEYTITDQLLTTVIRIRETITKLNAKRFPSATLVKMQDEARSVSTYSSTRIEGNPLPLTDVKRILKHRPENIRNHEREILNYNIALEWLNGLIDKGKFKLSNQIICEVQGKVTEKLEFGRNSGNFREQPVFVNNPQTRETVYWPPDHQDVPILMNDLVDFINNNDNIHHLIRAGIFHQQFVIIHPFIDGNGRTTRLVTNALLAKMGLNTFHLFSFENYYNNNITKYFQNVGVRGNYYDVFAQFDFTPWLEYFTFGILDELERVSKELDKQTNIDADLGDHHKAILKYIGEHGKIRDAEYAKLTDRSKASRALDFHELLDLGMIERGGQARSTYYILKD